jgi:tetratricopeptide (TPR) repeat protein
VSVVAVAPLRLSAGDDPEQLASGVARLLAMRIAGNGPWRRVAPEVVVARAAGALPTLADPQHARAFARELGAQAIIVGDLERKEAQGLVVRAAWIQSDEAPGEPDVVEERGSAGALAELTDRLADALLEGRVAAEERKIARIAAVTSPDNAALLAFLRGEESFARAAYGDAERLWEEAVERDPQFALAYLRLAELQRWRGSAGKATQARQQALLLSNRLPVSEREWLELELLAMRGEWDEARRGFRALLARTPNDWEGWCGLAALARSNSEPEAARQALARAVALLPQHTALLVGGAAPGATAPAPAAP